jgi:hypothetical protein
LPLYHETEGCYHHMSIFASQGIAVRLAFHKPLANRIIYNLAFYGETRLHSISVD